MRLVDADNARECFNGDGVTGAFMRRMFDSLPTIDAVHAAGGCYCRECSYRLPKGTVCQLSGMEITGDDFCSRGQSKGGDHE